LNQLDDRSNIDNMRKSNTRKVLIGEGLKALLANGYDGVGIGPVLTAAGVPKGSFYHFFRSKEDFACAVLEAYADRYVRLREAILADTRQPPLRRLRWYFDELERELASQDPLGGCLYGVLAQTMATRSEAIREKLSQSFHVWEESLRQVLREAQEAGDLAPGLDAKDAAAFLIDAYEGALIRMKSDGSPAAFGRFKSFALEPLLSRRSRD
jgi:TetR/AcrR family transcriptional regulator, transcriptional repressor for nem operon